MPGDKSISHRALILAALIPGRSRVRDIALGDDVRATADALRALGVPIPPLGPELVLASAGPGGMRPSAAPLDCGNSGTTARLLAGAVASRPFRTYFRGDAGLSRRPMERVAAPLRAMGARIELAAHGGLPMTVEGGELCPLQWQSAQPSAQVKSAVLLAALGAGVDVRITEPARSRDHTERLLRHLGADISIEGTTVRLAAGTPLLPLDLAIPGDPSSAAFLAALALMADDAELTITGVLLNPTRTGWIEVVRRMGAVIEVSIEGEEAGEVTGTVAVRASALHGTEILPGEIPSVLDELPLLACLAARSDGEMRVTGASELRVKESDRIALIVRNICSLGGEAEELPDGFVIRGSDRPLRGRAGTGGDHRIAMAFAVLAALPGNAIAIDEPDCVRVSYPEFWAELDRLRGADAQE